MNSIIVKIISRLLGIVLNIVLGVLSYIVPKVLVEPRNHLMLANKIIELLNNEELLMNMSINSRKIALEYDWNIIADKIKYDGF